MSFLILNTTRSMSTTRHNIPGRQIRRFNNTIKYHPFNKSRDRAGRIMSLTLFLSRLFNRNYRTLATHQNSILITRRTRAHQYRCRIRIKRHNTTYFRRNRTHNNFNSTKAFFIFLARHTSRHQCFRKYREGRQNRDIMCLKNNATGHKGCLLRLNFVSYCLRY